MNRRYLVVISPEAKDELEGVYSWLKERAPQGAARWIDGFLQAIGSLSETPTRCPIAPESATFGVEIRQLLYGKSGRRYRALYTIDGNEVNVHSIRHYAQDELRTFE